MLFIWRNNSGQKDITMSIIFTLDTGYCTPERLTVLSAQQQYQKLINNETFTDGTSLDLADADFLKI